MNTDKRAALVVLQEEVEELLQLASNTGNENALDRLIQGVRDLKEELAEELGE